MTRTPGIPAAPSDPGEDWARAIAEMTGAGEVTGAGVAGAVATSVAAAVADPAAPDQASASDPAAGAVAAADIADIKAVTPDRDVAPERRSRIALALISVATVVIGVLGIWGAVAAHDLRASAASANQAFTDTAATRAVDAQVTAAVNTIFSYSYADSARTRAAAQGLLTGPAIRQYNQLFAIVEQEAPKEKLIVTTRVTNIGIELLTGDRARVLVFANQQDSAGVTGKTSYGGAMFAVTAVNQHGKWRIESIDTFTGPA